MIKDEKKVIYLNVKNCTIDGLFESAIPTPERCDYLFQNVNDLKNKWNSIYAKHGPDWRNLTFGFVDSCTSLNDCFNIGFSNLQYITSLPKYVVGRNVTTALRFAYSCWGCSNVPGTIMDGLPNLVVAEAAFQLVSDSYTTEITIGDEILSKNTKINNLDFVCADLKNLRKAPELWKRFPNASHIASFRGDTNASNWNEIPSNWK